MKKIIVSALILALCLTAVFGLAACNNKKDWEYIEKQGEMVIGYTIFSPINYYNEDGEFIGFDTELAKAVCAELGVKPVFQKIDWTKKFVELESKNIDAIWNGFTVSEERKAETDFSVSYLYNKQIAVINVAKADVYTTIESMANAKTTAEAKSAGETVIKANAGLDANYTPVDTQTKALMEVMSKTSDIAIVDYVMASGTLSSSYGNLMIVDGVTFAEEEYAIGFRKGSPETVAKVNAALKKLYDDGTIATLAAKYNISESLKPIA